MARKPIPIFLISGRVIDRTTRQGASGLKIEAWDKDLIFDDLVGSTVTDEKGFFKIKFDESYFKEIFFDREPDLFFKVFNGDILIKSTEDSVLWNVRETTPDLVIEIDMPQVEAKPSRSVSGTVRGENGEPLDGATVLAFDRNLRTRQKLGEAGTIDADGKYRIVYTAEELPVAERGSADIFVEIRDNENNLLVTSDTVFNAPPDLTLNVTLPGKRTQVSEYELLLADVTPLLKEQGPDGRDLTIAELTKDDQSFIVNETGRPPEQVSMLILAVRAAHESASGPGSPTITHVAAETKGVHAMVSHDEGFASPGTIVAVFYGWFRVGQPQQFSELIRRPVDELMKSLDQAIEQNYIPEVDQQFKDQLRAALDRRRIAETLKPAPEGEPASLGDLLDIVSKDWLDANARLKVAEAILNHSIDSDDFAAALKEADIGDADIAMIRQTHSLGQIALGHAPAVQAMIKRTDGLVGDAAFGKLAEISRDDWLQIAYEQGAPVRSYMTPVEYARHLSFAVEDAAPTAALKAKINNKTFAPDKPGFEFVGAFLDANPAFDVVRAGIDDYFAQADIDGVDVMPEIKGALRQIQWTKRMGASWDEAHILIEEGLGHIGELADYGVEGLKKRLAEKIDDSRLIEIATRAHQTRAAGIGMMGYLMPLFNAPETMVMETLSLKKGPAKEIIDKNPKLRSLFGALDTCSCEPCRSVLSPAAYYADLLNFIEKDQAAASELMHRRPDLWDLLLSCENTEIELPHIDLVNEILENAVALPFDIAIPGDSTPELELTRKPLSGPILEALKSTVLDPDTLTNLTVEKDAASTPLEYGVETWVVSDGSRRWTLTATDEYLGPEPPNKAGAGLSKERLTWLVAILYKSDEITDQKDLAELLPAVRSKLGCPELPLQIESINNIRRMHDKGNQQLWKVTATVSGVIEVVQGSVLGGIKFSAPNGSPRNLDLTLPTLNYIVPAARDLSNGQFPPFLQERYVSPFRINFLITPDDANRWIYTASRNLKLVYRPKGVRITGLAYQSTASDRDLNSRPQNRNPRAYDNYLANSSFFIFPWTLPFDLTLTEIRALMKRAGIPRLEILETARPESVRYSDPVIAQERVGLSSAEANEIVTVYPGDAVWRAWGLDVVGNKATLRDSYTGTIVTDTPQTLLRRVSLIIQQARLSLAGLQDALQSRCVNPGNAVTLKIIDSCDPSKLTLDGISEDAELTAFLGRLRRFLRLQRRFGWSVRDLDIAMRALGYVNTLPNEDMIANLANLRLLTQRLKLPVEVVSAWFGAFDGETYRDILAGALGLKTAAYCAMRRLVCGDPLATPKAMLEFLDRADWIRSQDFDPEQLEYVLIGTEPRQDKPWVLRNDTARAILLDAQSGLRECLRGSQAVNATSAEVAAFPISAAQMAKLTILPAKNGDRQTRWGVLIDDSTSAVSWTTAQSAVPLAVLAMNAGVSEALVKDALFCAFVDNVVPTELDFTQDSKHRDVVSGLKVKHLDRIDRLQALHEITRLSPYLLDLAIQAFGKPTPGEPLDVKLVDIITVLSPTTTGKPAAGPLPYAARLGEQLRLPLDVVLSWWGGLGGTIYLTHTHGQGVFESLFSNAPALTGQRDTLVSTPDSSLSNEKLASAFGVAVDELDRALKVSNPPGTSPLTLAALSNLHRVLGLTKALGLSMIDLTRFADYYKRQTKTEPLIGSDPKQMLDFVNRLTEFRRESDIVMSRFAQRFGLDVPIVQDLMWQKLCVAGAAGDPVHPAIELFLGEAAVAFAAADRVIHVNGIETTTEGAVVYRLHKFSLLNAMWKLSRRELGWLPSFTPAAGMIQGLDVGKLPVAPTSTVTLFTAWFQSASLISLARISSAMSNVAANLVVALATHPADKPYETAAGSLHDSFDIPVDDVKRFAQSDLLGFGDEDCMNPLCLAAWIDALQLMRRMGLRADELAHLVKSQPDSASRAAAINALRSRFGEKGWLTALRESTNELRIQQRDRLVDFLVARDGLRDANDLYERYLIDVEMSPCMNTTRMLQSAAAVQLFMQRCMMNLEENVAPDIDPDHRWEWMQSYRVWEANRKVFLYPENWLFPEVRDDRTETFRAFESALTQSEPSHENALQALRQYLDDLVEISNVTVIGMYQDTPQKTMFEGAPASADFPLYLVGRTQNSPYRFFWRQAKYCGILGTRWTGWERIDLDMPPNHIIPFVLGGNLHIAWPIVKLVEANDAARYEVQLALARHSPTGWNQKLVSREPAKFEKLISKDERTMFMLRLRRVQPDSVFAIDLWSAVKPKLQGTTVTDANKFVITNSKLYQPVRGSQYRLRYWQLQLTVSLTVNYENTGRVVLKPCSVTIGGVSVSNEFWNKDPLTLQSDPQGQFGPIAANELSAVSLTILWDVVLHIKASFRDTDAKDPSKEVTLESQEVTFNFGGDDSGLPSDHPQPNGGDYYQAKISFLKSVKEDPEVLGEYAPLDMEYRGSFLVEGGSEIVWEPASGPVVKEIRRWDYLFFSSGYLESTPSGSGFLPVANTSEAGRMFVLKSGPQNSYSGLDYWYLEEASNRMIVATSRIPFAQAQSPSGNGLPPIPEYRVAIYTGSFVDAKMYSSRASGIHPALFDIDTQDAPYNSKLGVDRISNYIQPDFRARLDARDVYQVQFNLTQPYAGYNWEVFYHLPIAVAIFLSRQQRFEDARKWFHYIFDPTTNDPSAGRERFWRFLPFRDAQVPYTITQLLEALANPDASSAVKTKVQDQVAAWLNDPFNPFAVARLRAGAFEWYTVIAYIKNLVAWADQLYRRDTRESINEATLLYVMAAQILGPRPGKIRTRDAAVSQPFSYRMLKAWKGNSDGFSNVWLSLADSALIKAWMELLKRLAQHGSYPQSGWPEMEKLSSIGSLYFCAPPNEKLPELWDTVEDRLFKIRNCKNIEGVTRSLPLYEPPIDPELLIRARAAGLDLADVLADRFAPLPHYRFQALLQKANEFCNEVKSLGGAILSAIKKKEAEHLALLRSSQEIDMLTLIESVKEAQIKEAQANIDSLQKTRNNTFDRFVYLQRQLGQNKITQDASHAPIVEQSLRLQVQETGAPDDFSTLSLIQPEINQVWRLQDGQWGTAAAAASKLAAGVLKTAAAGAIADITGSTKQVFSFLGEAASLVGEASSFFATNASFWERRASLIAGWQRRRDEWVQQSRMTAEEIRQIDKQILALEIRKSIAEKELENHRKQIDNARNIDDYMRHMKFSGESLYGWMESQLAGLYFSAYQLASDLAKKVERAYQYEIGDPSSSFVQYGQWDNLRKGLLSGERLSQGLRRMEAVYLDQNRRELEITRHVSLLQLDPEALLALKYGHSCEFDLPETLFDLEFPGHYFRRIKSVGITIPCVTGPYTGVSAALTLLSSRMRRTATLGQRKYAAPENLEVSCGEIQSVATSSGQNDSGLFELNFRDERYLPFEGLGAISRWRLELSAAIPQFDYESISDAVMHVRYTAKRGDDELRDAASENVRALMKAGTTGMQMRLLSLRYDFPTEWARFKAAQSTGAKPKYRFDFKIRPEHFPYWAGPGIRINDALVYAIQKPVDPKESPEDLKIYPYPSVEGRQDAISGTLQMDGQVIPGVRVGQIKNCLPPKDADGSWSVSWLLSTKSMTDMSLALLWDGSGSQ